MTDFDPHHLWLGIPPAEQPAHHYRLLGIRLFEDQEEVIALAADRQMLFVRQFQLGPHQAASQHLLNQLAAAKNCLLSPIAKARYDAALQVASVPPHAEQFSEEPRLCVPDPNSKDFASRGTGETNRPTRVRGLSTGHKRRGPIVVRLLGHILAPLLGLMLGWQLLQWLRVRPSENAAAPVAAERPNLRDATSTSPKTLVTDASFPPATDVGASSAVRKVRAIPRAEPKPAENLFHGPSTSSHDEVQDWNGKRNEALSQNNLSAALVATERLAALEQADIIAAKLSVLETYRDRHSDVASLHTLAERSLELVDEAVRAGSPLAQQAAVFSLSVARQTRNTELTRRATLGVLNAASVVDVSSTSKSKTGEAK